MVAAAVLALLAPAAGSAQPQGGQDRGGRDRQEQGQRRDRDHRQGQQQQQQQQQSQQQQQQQRQRPAGPAAQQNQVRRQEAPRRTWGAQTPQQLQRRAEERYRPEDRRRHETAPIWRGYQPGRQRPEDRGWRGDRSEFNRIFRSARRFHAPSYRRPQGWYYHRWNYGEVLPRPFWISAYWLTNYWLYSLTPPPYGYIWVRYGDDALLVDQYTGEIVQVVYDVFY